MNIRLSVTLAATLSAVVPLAAAASTIDLWDISQGASVTAHSGVVEASSINNMFGGVGGVELGHTIFRDDRPSGFVHFVEWQTPGPVAFNTFNLLAYDDGCCNVADRGFTMFRLFAFDAMDMVFEQIFEFSPVSHPYPDNVVNLTGVVSTVVAQQFRAEFTQFAGSSFPGVRVAELDAFYDPQLEPVPEPGTLSLLLAPAVVVIRRRMARNRCSR